MVIVRLYTEVFLMVHGYQWLCMDFYGYRWLCMVIVVISGYCGYCGYQWLYAWLLWLSVVMHGYQWLSVAICMVIVVISGYMHGYQWLCMVIQWLVHWFMQCLSGGVSKLYQVFSINSVHDAWLHNVQLIKSSVTSN